MPRAPKTNHSLRQLRKAAGVTQEEVAEVLNVTSHTVTRIENGDKLKLTQDHANRLAGKYGVDPKSLLTASAPIDLFGRPYSEDSFERWKATQVSEQVTDELVRELGQIGATWISALLRTAKQKGIFLWAKYEFDDWLLATIERLGLSDGFQRNVRELTLEVSKRTYTVAEVRGNPGLMLELEFPKDEPWTGAINVEVQRESFVEFARIPANSEITSKGLSTGLKAVVAGGQMVRSIRRVKVLNKTWTVDHTFPFFSVFMPGRYGPPGEVISIPMRRPGSSPDAAKPQKTPGVSRTGKRPL